MRAGRAPLAGFVLIGLLVGVQLVATETGAVFGPHWHDPAAVTATEHGLRDLAAADGEPGGVAWLERRGDTTAVRFASVDAADGLRAGSPRTVATTGADLDDVGLASDGDRFALTWKNVSASTVHLAIRNGGEWTRRRVGTGLVVDEPSVAVHGGTPVVAWQARHNGTTAVSLAAVTPDEVTRHRLTTQGTGAGSPTLIAVGDRLALALVNASTSRAQVRFVDRGADGFAFSPWQDLGPARPRATGMGGGSEAATVDVAAADGTADVLWTDVATIHLRPVAPGGEPGAAATVDEGRAPAIGADGPSRLIAWIERGRTTSLDVVAAARTADATVTEPVSRLSSTATAVEPVLAPDPALAWIERGSTRSRLLVARYDAEAAGPGVLDRLAGNPQPFAAHTVGALVVGLVTLPMMPWSVGSLLLAFVLTTGLVVRRVTGTIAIFRPAADGLADRRSVRESLASGPPAVWIVAFGLGQTLLGTAVVLTTARARAVGFTAPALAGLGAIAAALAVVALLEVESNWPSVAVTAYAYNAAMWVTALPTFL
jgi:hypothetical protein